MNWILLACVWTAFLFFGLPWVPALGPLFDVRHGIWQHRTLELENATLSGLNAPVTITIDKNRIPHIFAENPHDLYMAQGYLTATYRLFQLDVSTRAATGSLTRLIGSRGLEFDRFFIRMGFLKSNKDRAEKYLSDPASREMMEAFALGVNQRIQTLKEYPPEYKILDKSPELYTPGRIIGMSKILTWNLSGRSLDLHFSEIANQIGPEKTLDLFPEHLLFEDYVWTKKFSGKRPDETPDRYNFKTSLNDIPNYPFPNPAQGSNNWVVAPEKSASGTSLMANDTHLGLSLPNIWLEMQLSTPEFNVYGVSLVGVPGIVNGFNKDAAWGPTNGTTDIHDFYEIEFKDDTSLEYKFGDQWLTAQSTQVAIGGSGPPEEKIDIVYTKIGPVVHREGKIALVSDWAGHRSKQELKAIRDLMYTKNVDGRLSSFKNWEGPIQNFVCADKNNIAWVHAGFLPKREVGHGRFIMDGRLGPTPIEEGLPEEFRPLMKNPPEGFILSANQKIAPPSFPYYMGWDYEPPFRGMVIRRALSENRKFTAQDMIDLQNDVYDIEAEILLPKLIKVLDQGDLGKDQKAMIQDLSRWDYKVYSKDNKPAIYKEWIVQLRKLLFEDEYKLGKDRKLYPRDLRIAALLENIERDPAHADGYWVDNRITPKKETLTELVTQAYQFAFDVIGSTTWKEWNNVRFRHVGRMPGFGSDVLDMDGSVEGVRGVNGTHGAVYKIVVETGDWPKAWIQVPGGLNGDPFAREYEDKVQDWADGKMRVVEFYKNLEEAKAVASKIVELRPENAGGPHP